MVKYLSIHNSSFALRYLFNVNGKAHTHPLLLCLVVWVMTQCFCSFFFVLVVQSFTNKLGAMVIPFLDWWIPNAQFRS